MKRVAENDSGPDKKKQRLDDYTTFLKVKIED